MCFCRYKWLETLLYIVIGVAPSVIIFEMVSVKQCVYVTLYVVSYFITQYYVHALYMVTVRRHPRLYYY